MVGRFDILTDPLSWFGIPHIPQYDGAVSRAGNECVGLAVVSRDLVDAAAVTVVFTQEREAADIAQIDAETYIISWLLLRAVMIATVGIDIRIAQLPLYKNKQLL